MKAFFAGEKQKFNAKFQKTKNGVLSEASSMLAGDGTEIGPL